MKLRLLLGDIIFCGNGFSKILKSAVANAEQGRATVFGYHVSDPQRFGVVDFNENGKVLSVEEKPANPKSKYAIDPTKIHMKQGWLPETMFADGIQKTIQWYLDNREWWQTIISGEYQNYYEKMYSNH